MTERPPNEVAAALRQLKAGIWRDDFEEAADLIDRLTRERDEWKTKWDSCDDAWQKERKRAETAERLRKIAEDNLQKMLERAHEAERELSEARAALEKAEGQLANHNAAVARHGGERIRLKAAGWSEEEAAAIVELTERAEAAEAACRSHAEAIGVLRALCKRVKEALDADEYASLPPALYDEVVAAYKAPIPLAALPGSPPSDT